MFQKEVLAYSPFIQTPLVTFAMFQKEVLAYSPFIQTPLVTFDEQMTCVLENCCRGQKVTSKPFVKR